VPKLIANIGSGCEPVSTQAVFISLFCLGYASSCPPAPVAHVLAPSSYVNPSLGYFENPLDIIGNDYTVEIITDVEPVPRLVVNSQAVDHLRLLPLLPYNYLSGFT